MEQVEGEWEELGESQDIDDIIGELRTSREEASNDSGLNATFTAYQPISSAGIRDEDADSITAGSDAQVASSQGDRVLASDRDYGPEFDDFVAGGDEHAISTPSPETEHRRQENALL